MLVNIIQNTISSFISAGVAAASVITTNLKMWLGFETSETLGREEFVDGNFPLPNVNWIFQSSAWSINNNKALYDDTAISYISQSGLTIIAGKTYQVSFDIEDSSGQSRMQISNQAASEVYSPYTYRANDSYVVTFTSSTNQSTLAFKGHTNGTSFSLSNVSLKEITQITPDKSGNNNVGELFTGKAIELDGLNDEIDFGTAQIPIKTISFWIKPLSVSNEGLFYLGLSSFPQFRQISITSGNISATSYFTNFTPYVNNIQTSAVTQDVWQRVVLTFDEWITTTLQIGKVYSSVYGHFAISDVQFYNETWSADDIAYDYANPNKLAIDNPSTNLVVTNLKGYWAMSEGDGKLAYDSGTNLEEEDVVNGDFATDSDWSKGTGWDIDVVNNKATCDGTQTTNSNLSQVVYTPGKVYKTIITVDSVDAGSLGIFTGTSNSQLTITEADTYTIIIEASTSDTIYIQANEFFDGSISNVSVREVTASNHGGLILGADYVDAQPRIPQLGMQNWSKGSNLFPYSEDFTEWVIAPTTSQVLLAASEAAPYGQGDVYSITMQASESDAYIRYATTNATLTSSTHSVWVKQAPTGSATHIRITNNNRAAWNTGTSEKIALTSIWQRLETTDAITGNRFTIIGSADASGTQDSDCLGKALIYGAQLVEGSSAGVYRFTDGAATSNSIVIANPTIPTQDIFGNAVRDRLNSFNLDGSGYAEVADDTDLDFGTGAFSFDGWAKYAFVNQGSSLNTIYTHLEDSANTSAGFSLNTETGGKISAWFGGVELELSAGLSEGDWFYFALTRDASGNVKLYASTDLENPATTTQNPILTITNAANKRVGGDATSIPNNGFSRHYHNLISDVRLYDAELSATEVENNYNAGLSAHTN